MSTYDLIRERDALRLLKEVMDEREREQLAWAKNRAHSIADFDHACRIFGLDPNLDLKDTTNAKHRRRALT